MGRARRAKEEGFAAIRYGTVKSMVWGFLESLDPPDSEEFLDFLDFLLLSYEREARVSFTVLV